MSSCKAIGRIKCDYEQHAMAQCPKHSIAFMLNLQPNPTIVSFQTAFQIPNISHSFISQTMETPSLLDSCLDYYLLKEVLACTFWFFILNALSCQRTAELFEHYIYHQEIFFLTIYKGFFKQALPYNICFCDLGYDTVSMLN